MSTEHDRNACWEGSLHLVCLVLAIKKKDHVYLRHLSTECQSILSADMATDTRPIYRPTLGQYVGRHVVLVNRPLVNTISRYVGQQLGRYVAIDSR